jgi:hypothetical protein
MQQGKRAESEPEVDLTRTPLPRRQKLLQALADCLTKKIMRTHFIRGKLRRGTTMHHFKACNDGGSLGRRASPPLRFTFPG